MARNLGIFYAIAELKIIDSRAPISTLDVDAPPRCPPEFRFVPVLQFGVWPTRLEAKARFARALDWGLRKTDDEFAAGHFDAAARNVRSFKCIRVCPEALLVAGNLGVAQQARSK